MQASLSPQGLGSTKNYLKILSEDQKGFRPQVLKQVTGLSSQALATTLPAPRARLYDDIVRFKQGSELMRKILHVVVATDVAYELMGNNAQDAALWLSLPNSIFFGYSPFEVCMQGRGEEVIEWLRVRAGKQEGTGF